MLQTRTFLRCAMLPAAAALALFAFAPAGLAAGDPPPPTKPKAESKAKAKAKPKPKPQTKSKANPKESSLGDDQIYSLGYWQAKSGAFQEALATLRTAGDQADPRIQTMIGYALRKLGRVDEAMDHYFAALAVDPNRTTTRQYLGEAFLQANLPAKAREQLQEIATRRGAGCEDYQLLAEAIAEFERHAG
jgi:predicted Zn-dependent protease